MVVGNKFFTLWAETRWPFVKICFVHLISERSWMDFLSCFRRLIVILFFPPYFLLLAKGWSKNIIEKLPVLFMANQYY